MQQPVNGHPAPPPIDAAANAAPQARFRLHIPDVASLPHAPAFAMRDHLRKIVPGFDGMSYPQQVGFVLYAMAWSMRTIGTLPRDVIGGTALALDGIAIEMADAGFGNALAGWLGQRFHEMQADLAMIDRVPAGNG